MLQPRKIACLPCRARKVKCTPGVPRCARCTVLGIEECEYGQKKKRKPGTPLRTGEACLSCRKRKRKCDAKRPCTTCIEASKEGECIYDGLRVCQYQTRKILPAATGALPLVYKTESGSHGFGSPSPETPPMSEGAVVSRAADSSLTSFTPSSSCEPIFEFTSADFNLSPSPSEESPSSVASDRSDPPPLLGSPVATSSELVLLRGTPPKQYSYDDSPNLSFIPSLLYSKTPRAPHVSLSVLGGPNLQVSHTTPGELGLTFRLAGLVRMKKMGIYFTPVKQEALANGDVSNAVLHPFFVYKVQALGMHYSVILEHSPPMVLLQARYVQKFWEELANIQQGNNLDLKVQSMFFLTSGCILVRLIQVAHLYLWKTCKMLDRGDMRFIPKYGHPPEFSDEIHEKSTVLSQIIWMENYMFLTLGGERPKLTTRIEEEFRKELPVMYPVLFRICPLTMRTRGILLVRDAVFLLESLHDIGEKPKAWRQSCDNLTSSLDEYSDSLMIRLGEFDKINDTEGASIIRSSCISCLAHLAALYRFVGEMQPSVRAEMNSLCDAALDNLGNLTGGFELEEVTYFDLLLKYSWTKAIEVFDSRIGGLSLEEGAQMLSWKGIVVEACVDFERRMPKCEPPMLTSLAWSEDGRDEGSKYPNLMMPKARERYGI